MHNYRGFQNTLVPIKGCSFLVGENSTGKSSFLFLLNLIRKPTFWFSPRFSDDDSDAILSFADIVSANAEDKSYFDVGIVNTRTAKSGRIELDCAVHRFADEKGTPKLSWHTQSHNGETVQLRFSPKNTEYSLTKTPKTYDTETAALDDFTREASNFGNLDGITKSLPKKIPSNPPLAIALSILRTIEAGEKPKGNEFKAEIPLSMGMTWIAPIRTKPQRIYGGISRTYSSEGEHSPFVLKTSLKSQKFAEKLAAFGDASGLFETVITHTFGKGANNPFEVLVRLRGTNLNINNVGYGVSQALPLVIEFLAQAKDGRFAVQQPEVHLHPRAQAALGSLLLQLAAERNHSFLVETHSDYLIDRFRLEMANVGSPPESQVLFFSRTDKGNCVTPILISRSGRYPDDQPKEFRNFFLQEEMRLLAL